MGMGKSVNQPGFEARERTARLVVGVKCPQSIGAQFWRANTVVIIGAQTVRGLSVPKELRRVLQTDGKNVLSI
jgi:hypothetical protein